MMRRAPLATRLLLMILAGIAQIALPGISRSQEIQEITPEGEKAILAPPGLQKSGAADPDVTIVEYFDYNCPYCRRIAPTFARLEAGDHKLAFVYKDWPMLGGASVHAARCALAAGYQGKYFVAHDALLAGPRLAADSQVETTLQRAGIDLDQLKKDLTLHAQEIAAVLARNDAEAHALDLDGTPGILIGRQLLPGGAELDFLQKLVAEARQAK